MNRIFTHIKELVTLKGSVQKDGRGICEEDLGIIKDGAFITRGEKILWVGPEKDVTNELLQELFPANANANKNKNDNGSNSNNNSDSDNDRNSEVVCYEPLRGHTVMPAFTECHTHLIFQGDRSHELEMRQQGKSYQEIAQQGGGILSTVKDTRKSTDEELYNSAKERVRRFVDQGVTCVEIKSGYGLDTLNEMRILIAAQQKYEVDVYRTFLGPHACPSEFSCPREYMNFILKESLPKVVEKKLAHRADIFIEHGYFDTDMARDYFKKAKKLGLPITAHVEQLQQAGGAQLAVEFGALSADHLVYANAEDIADLASSNTVCTFLPGADLYLNSPYPPARDFINAGACVALATDFNPGSCPTQNLSFIGVLARVEMKMTLAECLSAYTYGSAKALGLQHERGSITPGKLCDFILLEGSWRELFYSMGHHPIRQVWHRGHCLRSK